VGIRKIIIRGCKEGGIVFIGGGFRLGKVVSINEILSCGEFLGRDKIG
jgi:hypothetical protein